MRNIRPFLKCARNTQTVVNRIKQILPKGKRLIEPFVGDGNIFLNTNYAQYILADVNADLINTFKILAAYQEGFVELCKKYFSPDNNNINSYNYNRDVFNNINLQNSTAEQRINKACLFIWLNRHSFKGMIRYNKKGKFDVPYGYYDNDKIYFPKKEMFDFIKKINQAELIEFRTANLRETLARAQDGDVIYCDPLCVPLSIIDTVMVSSAGVSTWLHQTNLFTLCENLCIGKKVKVAIANGCW